jgi:hypothetical protein
VPTMTRHKGNRPPILPAVGSLFIAYSLAGPAGAQKADLETCRKIQAQIDHYTDLRRRGGRASEMERWKQKRSEYEEQFREYACHKHGPGLYTKRR